ncbi:MAG: FHA domain-containing protein [Anaerolineales bacterium]|nr:FHA domain-containing protein [Anaerolineales bacterium]
MSGPILLGLRIAMAVSLYVFLGFTLYTLWRELRQQSVQATPPPPPTLTLIITRDGDEERYRFDLPEIIIGRDPACDLVLSDSTVSTKHARLTYKHNQWWLEDMKSTNGTMLNEQQVDIPLVVTSGDRFTCGKVEISVEIVSGQRIVNPDKGVDIDGRPS